MADDGGVGLSLNLNQLLGQLFGTSSNTSGNGSGTSTNNGTTSTATASSTNGSGTNQSSTNQSNTGSNSGSTTGSNNSNTTGSSNSSTTGSNSSTSTSTTSSSADPAALAAERAASDQATKNASDPDIQRSILQSVLHSALLAFGKTGVGGARNAGLYNSSTLDLVAQDAAGTAAAEGNASILSYQTQEQDIALRANAAILAATGTQTTTGSVTGSTNSTTTGTSDQSTTGSSTGTSTGTSTGSSNSNTNGSNTSQSDQSVLSSGQTNSNAATTSTQQQTQETPSLFDSVICTELFQQGRLDKRLFVKSTKHFREYPEFGIHGYYTWSKPVVRYLRKNPSSEVSGMVEKIFTIRAKHIVGEKSLLGYLICGVTYSISWTLGRFLQIKGRTV